MPPQQRPGRRVVLVASFLAMALAVALLVIPNLSLRTVRLLDVVMVGLVLVAFAASRWRRR